MSSKSLLCVRLLISLLFTTVLRSREFYCLWKRPWKREVAGLGLRAQGFLSVFLFWPCHEACGILVPRPGIEPLSPALEVQTVNHWTIREVLVFVCLVHWLCSLEQCLGNGRGWVNAGCMNDCVSLLANKLHYVHPGGIVFTHVILISSPAQTDLRGGES